MCPYVHIIAYLLIAYLSCVTIILVFDSKWPLLYMVIMDERGEGRGGDGGKGGLRGTCSHIVFDILRDISVCVIELVFIGCFQYCLVLSLDSLPLSLPLLSSSLPFSLL